MDSPTVSSWTLATSWAAIVRFSLLPISAINPGGCKLSRSWKVRSNTWPSSESKVQERRSPPRQLYYRMSNRSSTLERFKSQNRKILWRTCKTRQWLRQTAQRRKRRHADIKGKLVSWLRDLKTLTMVSRSGQASRVSWDEKLVSRVIIKWRLRIYFNSRLEARKRKKASSKQMSSSNPVLPYKSLMLLFDSI